MLLTTYISKLSLTDSWKGTTHQFLSHFKEKLHLLDSIDLTLTRSQKQSGSTSSRQMFKRAMTSGRCKSLILFEDPGLVPQESLLLKSTMTYSGMQQINMTSTMLQETRKDNLSFPNNFIHFMNLTLILVKTLCLIKKRMILPPIQFFHLSILLNLKNIPRFFIPNQICGEFPEAAKKLIIEYNKKVKVANPKQHFTGGNLNLNLLWVNLIHRTSMSTFMTTIFLLITLILKTLLKQWSLSV